MKVTSQKHVVNIGSFHIPDGKFSFLDKKSGPFKENKIEDIYCDALVTSTWSEEIINIV